MIRMLKRHEVQVLLKAGHSCQEVARLTGLSRATVYRIQNEEDVQSVDDAGERKDRRIGRRSKAEPFRQSVEQSLKEDPEMLSVEILRRARADGYGGAKTALYNLVASMRPHVVRQMVRFEGLPGEFSQHDFGQVDVQYCDGRRQRVHFFASRLKYSRFAQVSLVPNQQVEALVRCLVDHFAAMGGIPLLAVFDRPKTVAIRWGKDGQVTEWNHTFSAVILELGLGVEPCWPYSPQQKGSVENLVGWVKSSFFKQRRFIDLGDVEQQLAQWLHETNTQRPSRATGVIPAVRLEEEKHRLRPLKVSPDQLALRFALSVGPTGMVIHDNHQYSMPPDAIGLPATLWLYRDRVRIVAGRFEAAHPRLFQPRAKSILPEHRAKAVAAVAGKRARRYAKREHLIGLGQPALDYIDELVHRRPMQWYRDVDLLHQLLQEYGDKAMLSAFVWGVANDSIGAEYLAHHLAHSGPPISQQGAFL
jgi:transposase